jgi:lysine 2,3-aminomutase
MSSSEQWKKDLKDSIETIEELAQHFPFLENKKELEALVERYPLRITPYFLKLMKEKGDPIIRQVVPLLEESNYSASCMDDPLSEEEDSPVPNLVHRYPDRVLLYLTSQCPVYCRFCTRKRFVGEPGFIPKGVLEGWIDYLKVHTEVRDIIMSGGDPLLLTDEYLEKIIQNLREIPHIEIIRIGTRVPGTLPSRITDKLCQMLKKYHPFYMNLHFNHPDEITPEVKEACAKLADAGIPLGGHTVLLKGINDDPEVMKSLMLKLLAIRVKPYYLYQADLVAGTDHFRTSVDAGLEMIKALRGHTSGMAVPHYVIDAPGGGGKIAVLPEDVLIHKDAKEVIVKNYENKIFIYPQPEEQPVSSPDVKP